MFGRVDEIVMLPPHHHDLLVTALPLTVLLPERIDNANFRNAGSPIFFLFFPSPHHR